MAINPRRTLPALAFLAALSLLASGCAFKAPTAEVRAVKLNRIDFESITTDFDIEIDNPNPIGATFAGYDYDFRIQDKSLLSGDQPDEVRIQKKAKSTVTVPVTIRFMDVVDLVRESQGKQKVDFTFAAGLKIKTPIGSLRIPVQKSGKLPVLQPPHIAVRSVTLDDLSWNGAKIVVKMDVKNKAPIKLGVDRVEWGLSLAGSEFLQSGLDAGGSLDPEEKRTMKLPLRIDFLDAGRSLYNVLIRREADYRIKGGVRFDTPYGKINLPFDFSGEAHL